MDNNELTADIEQQAPLAETDNLIPEEEPEIEVPQKPMIIVIISPDSLSATIELIKVTDEALNPDVEDIEAALAENGVVYGINKTLVRGLAMSPVYRQKIEIAKGFPEKTGADGFLIYLINTKKNMTPKERPDGTIDYHDLGFIQNVAKDQVLCEVHLAEKGSDGYTVFGKVLEGRFGRSPAIPVGKNVVYDEERSVIYSAVDGNADVNPNGIINVEDVLYIRGSIDTSTGNITFVGDIVISGDVCSGFKVESKNGNVTVKGTVEGAKIIAKGDIIVHQSVNGMNRARLTSGGNITCKYIQNCYVVSGGNISSDSIMYCTIECNGSIEITGKRGAIMGGRTIIANTLTAKGIGNDSHTATVVTMAGAGLKQNERINLLKKEIIALDTELISMIQTLTWCEEVIKKGQQLKPFQLKALEHARVRNVEVRQEYEAKNAELEAAQREMLDIDPSQTYIKCSGRIYPGVKIIFGTQIMSVQNEIVNSHMSIYDGEITVSSLS